jgi:hypothetical protein
MTNNTRQNSMGVFDCSNADPRNWKRITEIKDPGWTGSTPSPFHVAFSIDGSKMFVSELHGKPAKSSVLVIDTNTWKTIKRFDNVESIARQWHRATMANTCFRSSAGSSVWKVAPLSSPRIPSSRSDICRISAATMIA